MVTDALEESEEIIAKIVAHLAKAGVRQTDLSTIILGYENNPASTQLFINALRWLKDEGIVRQHALNATRGGTQHETVATNCVLTSLGFALLAEPFRGELSLGSAVKNTVESGSGYSNTGSFFGGILGGFTKSISS